MLDNSIQPIYWTLKSTCPPGKSGQVSNDKNILHAPQSFLTEYYNQMV